MKAQGRTLLVVHHDLQTAPEYFDSILMLNMRLVAFGPTSEVFTTPHFAEDLRRPIDDSVGSGRAGRGDAAVRRSVGSAHRTASTWAGHSNSESPSLTHAPVHLSPSR